MRLAAIVLAALSSYAYADPPAPPPDQASGIETDDRPPTTDRLLVVPRLLLAIPRAIVWTVGQPLRGGAYVYEHYHLPSKFRDTFFNVDGTFGIYPIISYETEFGLTGGARLVHHDLFGAHERLRLRADFGGRYRQGYGLNFRTGDRFRGVTFEIDSSYERRPREKFFGIGNADDAMLGKFHEDVVRNVAAANVALGGNAYARTSGALMLRSFTDAGIAGSYDTSQLVGFDNGVRNIYVEQELVLDTRRPASQYQSEALGGIGSLVTVHAGLARGVDGFASHYGRVGGEALHYIDLYRGSRILALRVLVDSVVGDITQIPFTDLPRLGGNELLRGYATGRFRDRAVVLGTLEYTWDIGNDLGSYLFVDAGRTYHELDDVDIHGLHVGVGGGVQVHTRRSFIARMQIAGSTEDLIFQLALSPSLGRRERAGQY